jgi:hypothetical protein
MSGIDVNSYLAVGDTYNVHIINEKEIAKETTDDLGIIISQIDNDYNDTNDWVGKVISKGYNTSDEIKVGDYVKLYHLSATGIIGTIAEWEETKDDIVYENKLVNVNIKNIMSIIVKK